MLSGICWKCGRRQLRGPERTGSGGRRDDVRARSGRKRLPGAAGVRRRGALPAARSGQGCARTSKPVVTWAALRPTSRVRVWWRPGCPPRRRLARAVWPLSAAFGGRPARADGDPEVRRPQPRTGHSRPFSGIWRRPARGFLLSCQLPAGRGAPSGPDLPRARRPAQPGLHVKERRARPPGPPARTRLLARPSCPQDPRPPSPGAR